MIQIVMEELISRVQELEEIIVMREHEAEEMRKVLVEEGASRERADT